MPLDSVTTQLFCRLPRSVGNPNRHDVFSVKDIEDFIKQNEGQTDSLFISLYPSNSLIDKMFFDADYGDFIFEDFVQLFDYAIKNNLNPIPLITGLKGSRKEPRFHLYTRLTPHIYGLEAKILLYKSQMKILTDVFGDFDKVMVDRREKYKLPGKTGRYIAFDPTATGDIKRIVRIPQTRRLSNPQTYCTYLPLDFPSMTKRDLLEHCMSKHTYTYPPLEKRLLLTDNFFDFDLPQREVINLDSRKECLRVPKATNLKFLLRPCVFNAVNHIHPSYKLRSIATVDLYDIGFNEEQITQLFSELGWEDFNEETTRLKVNYYCSGYRNGVKPTGCQKLRELGVPLNPCPPCCG